MLDLPFKIVIPSHHRPKDILRNPLYPFAYVVVNDSKQVDEYRSAAARANIVPGEFHVCGELPSIAAVRNFMLREVWDTKTEPFFVQMDDDFRAMMPMMVWRSRRVSSPEDVAAIFWESYISSNDAGAKVFGYGHKASPQHRGAHTPITLRGWIRAVTGISDPTLQYDEKFYLMEDLDIALASQAKDRIVWQDYRSAPVLGANWAKGGIAHSRTEERRLQCYDRINAKYGPGTIKPRAGKSTNLFSLRI